MVYNGYKMGKYGIHTLHTCHGLMKIKISDDNLTF